MKTVLRCKSCGRFMSHTRHIGEYCCDRCFKKGFWKEHLDDTAIIINGICYHIDSESLTGFKGHDGRKIKIKMNDGRQIETCNLWSNGIVPKEYYKGDNAKFM